MAADPQIIEATRLIAKTVAIYGGIAAFVGAVLGLTIKYFLNKAERLGKLSRDKWDKRKKVK